MFNKLVFNFVFLFIILFALSTTALCSEVQNQDCKQAIHLIEKDIAKSYSLCPGSEQIVYKYVEHLISKNAFEKARKTLKNSNKSPLTKLASANLHIAKNENEEAKEILNSIIIEEPNSAYAFSMLATIEFKNNNFKKSESLYKQAIKLSKSKEDYYNLALALEMQNRLEEARITLESVFNSSNINNSPEIISSLCRVFIKQNKFKEAKKLLSSLGNNKNHDIYYCEGLIELQKNNNQKAIDLFNKSINIKKDTNVLISKLLTEIKLEKSNSFDTLLKLFKANSKNPEIVKSFLWAVAFTKNQEHLKSFDKHLDIIKNDSSALNNYGIIKSLLGDKENAKQYFFMSLDLNPDNLEAKKNLGDM